MSLTIQQIIEETKIRKQLDYEKAQAEQLKTPALIEKETEEEEAFKDKRKENYVDHVNTFLFPNKIKGKKNTVQKAEFVEARTAKDTNDALTSETNKTETKKEYAIKEAELLKREVLKKTEEQLDKEKIILEAKATNDTLINETGSFVFLQKEEKKDETTKEYANTESELSKTEGLKTTETQAEKNKDLKSAKDTNNVVEKIVVGSVVLFTQADKNKTEEKKEYTTEESEFLKTEVLKKTEEQLVKEKGVSYVKDTNDALTSETGMFYFSQKEEKKEETFKLKGNTEQTLERRKSEERKALGHIYVSPVNIDVIGKNAPFLKIPLQTNLSVASNEIKAAYNATDFLNRIGSVQQYVRTESQTFSLETEYHMTSDNEEGYSMSDLQRIEKMYQSLVFPKIRNITLEADNKYSFYSRPPIINIAIGDFGDSSKISVPSNNQLASTSSNANVINNFFTYIKYQKETPTVYFKDFVVTSVSIEKDYKETPFYMAKKTNYVNGKVVEDYVPYDLLGFSVKLEIIEIDPNYFGVSPTFDDYAKFAYGVSGN